MNFDKIKAPTVRESFVRELENKILSGELKPGDKLPPAKELCELMGVSLTVVNAGMSELANNGFVETIPRRGTYIADYKKKGNAGTLSAIMRYNGGKLSSKEIRALCETRMALDLLVARLVVERATDAELHELEPLLDELRAERDLERCCELVTEFYHRLAEISGNIFLSLLYNSTFEPQKGIYVLFCEKNGTAPVGEHAVEVYESLLARDVKRAQNDMFEAVRSAIIGDNAII